MRINSIEIYNFRRLHKAKLDLSKEQTLFVGANNSGKTSAMVALRVFLKDRVGFSVKDITASNWSSLETIAEGWLGPVNSTGTDLSVIVAQLPYVDVWVGVSDNELLHVAHLIPNLDWESGELGVRIRLEPKSLDNVISEYRDARLKAQNLIDQHKEKQGRSKEFSLWPKSFQDFLERRMSALFTLNSYLLDPKRKEHKEQILEPQELPDTAIGIGPNPFSGLLHIREINAQRGFTDASDGKVSSLNDDMSPTSKRKLSDQLQSYYQRHLNPDKDPTEEDVSALDAFHSAQKAFDVILKQSFAAAIEELGTLGYPGIANPKMAISTNIRPIEGLKHSSAVQYDISGNETPLRLPENYNGLGFQNLISMVFMLMSFRDDWMRVGKHSVKDDVDGPSIIEPLQLILIEEPEAHLHAQVQQVFMRRALEVLRNHDLLKKENSPFTTQLIVSTHSSHIAHEVEIADLQYFKRKPATADTVPTSRVVNLSSLFGTENETSRFATRYLRSTHCDLFFADGVIMIEGAAERILLPHFIKHAHKRLSEKYISLLEIGGSHAHRLKPLVELLEIPTLVITDLDAVDPNQSCKAVAPKKGSGYVTSNNVLKKWLPKKTGIDELLDEEDVPEISAVGFGRIGVVYQRDQELKCENDPKAVSVVPSTFEDALVISNLEITKTLRGCTMTNAFAKKAKDTNTACELAQKLFKRLSKNPQKAAFALDLLSIENFEELTEPPYIKNGLSWLEKHLTNDGDVG